MLPDSPAAVLSRYSAPVTWKGPPIVEAERTRQGPLKTHRVRAVCRRCNNGWMGALEEQVRPALTGLMTGRAMVLSSDVQRTLAEWLTLKLMVAEQSSPLDAAITREERRAFHLHRELPPALSLHLFRCGVERWQSAYYRAAFTMARLPRMPDPNRKNVASVALGMAELFVLGVYDRPGVLNLTQKPEAGFVLWPSDGHEQTWPPSRRLSQEEAVHIADTVSRFAGHPNVELIPYGPLPGGGGSPNSGTA